MKETKQEKDKRVERLKVKQGVISAVVDNFMIEELIIGGKESDIMSLTLTVIENVAELLEKDTVDLLVEFAVAELTLNEFKKTITEEDLNNNDWKKTLEKIIKEKSNSKMY